MFKVIILFFVDVDYSLVDIPGQKEQISDQIS